MVTGHFLFPLHRLPSSGTSIGDHLALVVGSVEHSLNVPAGTCAEASTLGS